MRAFGNLDRLVALLLALPASCLFFGCIEEPASTPDPEPLPVFTVWDAGGLWEAVGSNRVIELLGDRYVLDDPPDSEFLDPCLSLEGIENLEIRGLSCVPVALECNQDRPIVWIEKSRNVVLHNLEIRHWEVHNCSSDCVIVRKSENVTLSSCVLLGCGISGFEAWESSGIALSKTRVSECDCPVGLRNCAGVRMVDCELSRNRNGSVLTSKESSDVVLEGCRIRENRDPDPEREKVRSDLIWVVGGSPVNVKGGQIVSNRAEHLALRLEDVVFFKTVIANNEFLGGRFRNGE